MTVEPALGLITTELGGDDTFTVVLNSEPTASVTVSFDTTDPTEGTPGVTSLVFTPVNWNAPRTVTVTGQDDFVQDGKVNEAGIAKLRERMPFADLTKFEAEPVVQNLGQQLTVKDMCNFVAYKLAA